MATVPMEREYEIQFKTPLREIPPEDTLEAVLKQKGIDVGTDGYYQDPQNYYTVIVRSTNIAEFVEVRRVAQRYGATEEIEEEGVVSAQIVSRSVWLFDYPTGKWLLTLIELPQSVVIPTIVTFLDIEDKRYILLTSGERRLADSKMDVGDSVI